MEYSDGVWISPPDKNANIICDIVGRIDDREAGTQVTDEDLANAQLIAAAPELFAACERLITNLDEGHKLIGAFEQIRLALNKAKGA